MLRPLFSLLLASLLIHPASAAEVTVAVAANFAGPMQKIAAEFERDTQHKAVLVTGSTGAFFHQITQGAPFDVLLAADDATALQLEKDGFAVDGSRFTYAVGRLALWSKQPGMVDAKGDVLRTGTFERIAIANPAVAPYGAAAVQALTGLGLLSRLSPKFVQGDNIAQTYLFAATGNAPLAFVALSQVSVDGRITEGSAWVVPANLHSPIRQDAVLLKRGRSNPAAEALMAYLRGAKPRGMIRSYGYE